MTSVWKVALVAGLMMSMPVAATEIRVFSGGAPKEVFAELVPAFEQQTGNKVTLVYAVITALREKIAAGEKADVLVLPVPVLDGYVKDGKARADARATFANLSTSVIVKAGAPKPDVSTKEKFRAALLAARSVVYSTPGKTPSGTHMGKVVEQLGLTEAMAKKTVYKPALEGGVQLVASGEAEIGIYPTSEVAAVKGIAIVGPLPAGVEFTTVYGAAATTGSPEAAAAFVKFMAAAEHRAVWKHAGFDPPEN